MNLILLTIDCLRADHLGCLGYSKQTTPNLDNLASRNNLFTQAISVGPATLPSFTATFTSTYPLMYGGRLYDIADSRDTLAQVLQKHGYHTAAFHTNPLVSSFYGYHEGFDTFSDGINKLKIESWLSKPKALVERILGKTGRLHKLLTEIYSFFFNTNFISKAEVLNSKAISWLRGNQNPFFLWIHYMDVHEPYTPVSRSASLLKKYQATRLNMKARYSPDSLSTQEIDRLNDLYDANIRYVDREISSLMHTLKQGGMLDDTLVIITADHGQQLMERGYHGHGRYLYDELIRVPLIIIGPGLGNKVIEQQVSLLDLAPTILDILGVEQPGTFLGNSFLPVINENGAKPGSSEVISETDTVLFIPRIDPEMKPQLDASYRRISLRTDKWKYIYSEGGPDELYCLADDPKEMQNLIGINPEMATELRTRIVAHIEFEEQSKSGEEELIKARVRRLKRSGKL